MKDFIFTCVNNLELFDSLYIFRDSIKVEVFKNGNYYNIVHRLLLMYYPANTRVKQETCLQKCWRRSFTSNPSPDVYDYGIKHPTTDSFAKMVYILKKQFGYSNRCAFSNKIIYRHLNIKVSLTDR